MGYAKVHPYHGAGGSKRGKGCAWDSRQMRKKAAKKLRRRWKINEADNS